MSKNWVLTPDLFEGLLDWLDPDREIAGEKYEHIRRALIKIFISNGRSSVEDLADEAINRVARKLNQIRADYQGDPSLYFYGVAKKIVHEDRRKPAVKLPPPPSWNSEDDVDPEYECLEKCLQELTAQNRELVLQYYQEEKKAKIDNRRRLADKLGIAINALRIRAHRIRNSLELCVRTCVGKMTSEMN
jgi:DNA-directed RNA polymerase specialized sigma24 family protein